MRSKKIEAKDLLQWQKERFMTYGSFAGHGHRGSLSSNGVGIFLVMHNDKRIYRGRNADQALRWYNAALREFDLA